MRLTTRLTTHILVKAGLYILHDDEEQAVPGLPQGTYDIGLVLASKRYNSDGTLWDPDTNGETTSVFGDVFHVNGQPWPHLKVEPRKYRFRFLDAAVSRSFQMYLVADKASNTRVPFTVVGSDAGLLDSPVPSTQLDISMAERWEVVVDFSKFAGQNMTLKNNRDVAADQDYTDTDKIMRFIVSAETTEPAQSWDNQALPAKLRNVPFPPPAKSTTQVDRSFTFGRSGSGGWTINGVTWGDGPEKRVLAKPQRGNVEVWELKNGGGGWSHPIHIHLIDFQVISRTGGRPVLPYEKVALKDVVWLNTGETVRVIARYAPWDGLYMASLVKNTQVRFHCHNLIHEDHAMMGAFNVSFLADLGYSEKTHFLDPMDPAYRAKSFADSDYTARSGPYDDSTIQNRINDFTSLEAYKDVDKVEAALEAYWLTKTTLLTVTSTSKATSTSAPTTLLTVTSTSVAASTTDTTAATSSPASESITQTAATQTTP
ncbi:hypothetical protein LTR56_021113 [Elasticomyces elasticus]|nr:hypothetical protein LTR56_021113 [Elasticomyces elasticus]KAK3631924.1 hypothetical protein LTR22_020857 [Elasticomyces elasticus]KAK4909709.1 hypothetical protein LTR49_021521 [Elasticomyces elasticus]KAK5749586.1 hypothetical protein LTS12_020373 [Elasticomyces elasticus]